MNLAGLTEKNVEAYRDVLTAALARDRLMASTMERDISDSGQMKEMFRVPAESQTWRDAG
jgi:hypothetical protein